MILEQGKWKFVDMKRVANDMQVIWHDASFLNQKNDTFASIFYPYIFY